jgi:hypothetical protein
MRLTERDQRILEAIHAHDGLLSFPQIKRIFFKGKSQAEVRLRLLYQHGYVNRPTLPERRRVPEMIYWLDRGGAEIVASLNGTPLQEFPWRREPRWFQVEHDLAVNDFRLDIEAACQAAKDVTLETWIPESEFWAHPDQVTYKTNEGQVKRRIRPDGLFTLTTGGHRFRYLLEIDRSTEDNPRFLREKIVPGLAYLKSEAYNERFGHRSGRWLVVTTGERRLGNMLRQAQRADTRGLFYFTTYDKLNIETVLSSPIWRRADRQELVPLFFIDQIH